MSASTFTQHRQIGVCKVCGHKIFKLPIKDVQWFHAVSRTHHAAVYYEGQRTTPAEGMVLLTAWLKWHGRVLSCEVRDEPQMRLYSVERREHFGPIGSGDYLTDATDVSGSPVLHSWGAIPADEWHAKWKLEGGQ